MADVGKFKRNKDGTITHSYTRVRTVDLAASWEETLGEIEEIENLPEEKIKPDRETLEYYNEMVRFEQKRKPDLLQRLKWKRDWSLVMEAQGVLDEDGAEKLRRLEKTIESYE